jgi:hypothetical protein
MSTRRLACDGVEIDCRPSHHNASSYTRAIFMHPTTGFNCPAASHCLLFAFAGSFRLVLTRRQRGSAGSPVPKARFPIPTKLEYFFFPTLQ